MKFNFFLESTISEIIKVQFHNDNKYGNNEEKRAGVISTFSTTIFESLSNFQLVIIQYLKNYRFDFIKIKIVSNSMNTFNLCTYFVTPYTYLN